MRIFALLALGLTGMGAFASPASAEATAGGAAAPAPARAAATPNPTYILPEAPDKLMLDEAAYAPFARTVAADADRLLAAQPGPAREKLLLGMRVHLALHFGEARTALRLAERIQAGQADPAERAFAGLTTRAMVAAWAGTGAKAGSPAFAAAFARELATQLATLPSTPEIAAMLRGQREKNAAISREALLREALDRIDPLVARDGRAGLAAVDALVRARHRLTEILPVRAEMLEALDRAIALRSHRAAAPPLPPVAPVIVPLWPDDSPNNPAEGPRPRLEVYAPFPPARTAGATIVILPGGGYSILSPFERLYAEYFRALGYGAVVVDYRVAPNPYPAAYADALRAVRLVRRNAAAWGLPGPRLALLGGSAGGHLAALVATRPDFYRDPEDDLAGKISARPDRLILLYPVISAVAAYRHASFTHWFGPGTPETLREAVSPERHVTRDAPPAIIFAAADDSNAIVANSLDFARACWSAGVPAELHVFPRGGHGYRFAYDAEVSPRWRGLLAEWLALWKD